ncbi:MULTISPECIES: MATE family efflux transporter [unclassified Clostridioides]|uniref:MATE family efflux transporter n=1 Tax=unclassified Clostridioides TaxID=2635829 RepID=UPI001D111499|nr:MATE family efflux transporter [Clostridioides sp. ES-S-0171-01]MCC0688315.1 MATE family efflux transporter [Clostridioides sp. ES-S-0056-01]MCC0715634.1 MATE family efflux transporter [Clostridioides sp. ES-S-0077-01]UDN54437.1 MATE family efflux transporter [Clostridioides sp. ES-S-0054-01]
MSDISYSKNQKQDNVNVQDNLLAQRFNMFSLLKFAFPTIFMMIFMGLYTIVDTIFVSRFVNTNALSAINIVCPIINIIVGLGTMLATGGSAIVARKMGNGDIDEAKKAFTLIVLSGVVLGMIITGIGIIFMDYIIIWLGASEILIKYCRSYLFIILVFAFANILQVLFQSLFVTAGKPQLGLWLVIGAGCTNIILDYVFIVLLQMGIGGAALATGIGYLIPTIAGIVFFSRNKGVLRFCIPKLDKKVLFETCFNGSSEMVSQLSTAVTTFLFNIIMMELIGEDGVAAITIIIYSQFLLTSLYIGFSMGVAPIISYNYGSKDNIQLKYIFKTCILFISVASLLVFVFSILCSPTIVDIFSQKGSDVYEITSSGFYIFSFSFIFCGFNIFASSMFTALSNGKISAVLSFLRTFGFITIGLLILPKVLDIDGIWLVVPIAEFLTLFLTVVFIYKYKNKYNYI